MIRVQKLLLGSVPSLEITPLPGSHHPAFETKLLDPLFSLDFVSDSAQDVLWAASRNLDQESSEEEEVESNSETLDFRLDSQQTPRKRGPTSSSVITATTPVDELPQAPLVPVPSRPKNLDTIEHSTSNNKPTVSFSAPNISSVPIGQSTQTTNRPTMHVKETSGVDETVVSNRGSEEKGKGRFQPSSSEDSRTESNEEIDREETPSDSTSHAYTSPPFVGQGSSARFPAMTRNNVSGDGTLGPSFPSAGNGPEESNTSTGLPTGSLVAHLQNLKVSPTVTSPPKISTSTISLPEAISSISMYTPDARKQGPSLPSLPSTASASEQIAVSSFQKGKPHDQSVRLLHLNPTAPMNSSIFAPTSQLETSNIGEPETRKLFYQPKVFPRLFDAKGPVPKMPQVPVLPPLAVNRRQKMIKSLSVPFTYTISDDYIAVKSPVVPDAKPGDVHIHRNRLLDSVNIWVLNQQEWINCTESWATNTANPVRHPLYSSLILDTDGENSWVPSYIKESTYKGRSAGRVGIMGQG